MGNFLSPAPIPPRGRKLNPSSGKNDLQDFSSSVECFPLLPSSQGCSQAPRGTGEVTAWAGDGEVAHGPCHHGFMLAPVLMSVPCLSPSLTLLPGLQAVLTLLPSVVCLPHPTTWPLQVCWQSELFSTTQENIQLLTRVLGEAPTPTLPLKVRPSSLCSQIPPAHLGPGFLPIASPPNCRITPSAGRKSHSSFISFLPNLLFWA